MISSILDIAIKGQNNNGNDISWVVLDGDEIVTKLPTITEITSNVTTTTTKLIDDYLFKIFETINIFIAVSITSVILDIIIIVLFNKYTVCIFYIFLYCLFIVLILQ